MNEDRVSPERRETIDESLEVYANAVQMHSGVYDLLLRFVSEQISVDGSEVTRRIVSSVRMSIEHAWVFSRILARHIDERVQRVPISLPIELIQELGLEEDYARIVS